VHCGEVLVRLSAEEILLGSGGWFLIAIATPTKQTPDQTTSEQTVDFAA
jgi:hypothetical protein